MYVYVDNQLAWNSDFEFLTWFGTAKQQSSNVTKKAWDQASFRGYSKINNDNDK